ncbi:MAG: hypothetical protein DRG78_16600 [Epsilonproteobacteria bacterium]|nr:MAG: hypothetical protein DRG78_16600 [Campylobacterota bacterium]
MKSITEIQNKVKITNQIISKIRELEKLSLEFSIDENDRKIIESEILELKKRIKNGVKIDQIELNKTLEKYDLDSTDIEDIKVEYLIDNCIIKGEITMIVAPPGQGKSSFAIATAVFCLKNRSINNLLYLDLDNSLVTLSDRKINKLKDKFNDKFKYLHSSSVSKTEMLHILNILSKASLKSYLIVFDSSKNFMGNGKDRDSNKDVSEFLNIIKTIRNNGATVLLLHHVNKPQKDMEMIFAGAAAWLEDVSSAFMLQQNRFKNTFILQPLKERVGNLCEVAFKFNKKSNSIENCELFYAKETEESEQIRITIANFIQNNEKPTYSQILNYCTEECGFSKNKVNGVIQTAKNQYWKAIKEQKYNNRDVYILLDKQDKCDNLDRVEE